MFKPFFMLIIASLWLAGCATAGHAPPPVAGRIAPREAIVAAADAAPRGVPGVFAMQVTATGRIGGRVFLNSEADYRDQRNLTIAIEPRAAERLAALHGAAPESYFRGKSIEVRGAARRVRIDFIENRRPTGLYYYQTHVPVTDPEQISIVG